MVEVSPGKTGTGYVQLTGRTQGLDTPGAIQDVEPDVGQGLAKGDGFKVAVGFLG